MKLSCREADQEKGLGPSEGSAAVTSGSGMSDSSMRRCAARTAGLGRQENGPGTKPGPFVDASRAQLALRIGQASESQHCAESTFAGAAARRAWPIAFCSAEDA